MGEVWLLIKIQYFSEDDYFCIFTLKNLQSKDGKKSKNRQISRTWPLIISEVLVTLTFAPNIVSSPKNIMWARNYVISISKDFSIFLSLTETVEKLKIDP